VYRPNRETETAGVRVPKIAEQQNAPRKSPSPPFRGERAGSAPSLTLPRSRGREGWEGEVGASAGTASGILTPNEVRGRLSPRSSPPPGGGEEQIGDDHIAGSRPDDGRY